MSDALNVFKGIIIMQAFYALAITLIAYSIPASALNYAEPFQNVGDAINMTGISTKMENSIAKQSNMPLIELGALVFYSGNIMIDLLLNFMFAIPQMLTLIINAVMMVFNIETFFMNTLQIFLSVIILTLYILGIIQLLLGIRSGNVV